MHPHAAAVPGASHGCARGQTTGVVARHARAPHPRARRRVQRKGYGRFLIAFSYELSRKEGKVGHVVGRIRWRVWRGTCTPHIRGTSPRTHRRHALPRARRVCVACLPMPCRAMEATVVIKAAGVVQAMLAMARGYESMAMPRR